MKKITLLAASSLLALTALPQMAHAQCGSVTANSATITCENGVQVIRQAPTALPRISPYQAQQLKLQREQIAAQKRAAAERARLNARRLELEQQKINNQSYLYRDANSPLRGRRGARGVIVVGSGN